MTERTAYEDAKAQALARKDAAADPNVGGPFRLVRIVNAGGRVRTVTRQLFEQTYQPQGYVEDGPAIAPIYDGLQENMDARNSGDIILTDDGRLQEGEEATPFGQVEKPEPDTDKDAEAAQPTPQVPAPDATAT